jgi:glutamate-1-semialdehyde 2,1-aminomutase
MLQREAELWLPGGNTRTINYYPPHPAFIERGEGSYIFDYDGNRYVDFLNNYTALIHGHAHPMVVKAVCEQVQRGAAIGAPCAAQAKLASNICRRIPAMEKLRFTNSGTEATMWAVRTARAFTNRDVIVKIDGGYHGTHEWGSISGYLDGSREGALQTWKAEGMPRAQISRGVPPSVLQDVVVVPFNDLGILEAVLREGKGRIAAVVLEPLLGPGGGIPPQAGYLKAVRALTTELDALLLFDESDTFRLHEGGLQAYYGVEPDITALSKIIGGGLPLGAFGGREEIMSIYDPRRSDSLYHSGAFVGHNLAMVAGAVSMELFDAGQVEKVNQLGERLSRGLNRVSQEAGIHGHAVGFGSYWHFHWGADKPVNAFEASRIRRELADLTRLTHLELLNRGICLSRYAIFCTSTSMTTEDVDECVAAFAGTLAYLKEYVANRYPQLIAD